MEGFDVAGLLDAGFAAPNTSSTTSAPTTTFKEVMAPLKPSVPILTPGMPGWTPLWPLKNLYIPGRDGPYKPPTPRKPMPPIPSILGDIPVTQAGNASPFATSLETFDIPVTRVGSLSLLAPPPQTSSPLDDLGFFGPLFRAMGFPLS